MYELILFKILIKPTFVILFACLLVVARWGRVHVPRGIQFLHGVNHTSRRYYFLHFFKVAKVLAYQYTLSSACAHGHLKKDTSFHSAST